MRKRKLHLNMNNKRQFWAQVWINDELSGVWSLPRPGRDFVEGKGMMALVFISKTKRIENQILKQIPELLSECEQSDIDIVSGHLSSFFQTVRKDAYKCFIGHCDQFVSPEFLKHHSKELIRSILDLFNRCEEFGALGKEQPNKLHIV